MSFLLSFAQLLSTAKFSLFFQQYNFSKEQMYKEIQHCFCCMFCLPPGDSSPSSLSSGSRLVWWFSTSAVQMSLWNFSHHPFISVLCYAFCFLDSISSFFFCLFPCSSRDKLFWKLHIISEMGGTQDDSGFLEKLGSAADSCSGSYEAFSSSIHWNL